MEKVFKLVVTVPVTHGDAVREAIAKAGAGKIGNYDYCSFTVRGVGRFRPLKGSNPAIGQMNQLEEVEEERIETICEHRYLKEVITAIHGTHPYEEPVIDIYSLVDTGEFYKVE